MSTEQDDLGFHATGGWYFKRRDDFADDNGGTAGKVMITAQGHGGDHTQIIMVDANTWASIVASVSAGGEDADSHRAALAFHQGSVT